MFRRGEFSTAKGGKHLMEGRSRGIRKDYT
jgi:hypothetical protein